MPLPEQNLIKLGYETPRVKIYKSESHKLNEAFPFKKETIITQGMPVKLATDGTVEPYLNEGNAVYLGIAHTDSINPAYHPQRNFPGEVTVMVEGFAIVHGIAKNAITEPGYVEVTADIYDNRFVGYSPATAKTKFIALHPAEVGEVVKILVR